MSETRPLHVLWFTDWPTRAVREHFGEPGDEGAQAWVDGLRDALEPLPGLRLTIAVSDARGFAPFEERGTRYVAVPQPAPLPGARGVARRWLGTAGHEAVLAAARTIVRDERPDVVHVHGTENPYGLLAAQVAPLPVVVSLQGLLLAYHRVYFAGRPVADIARLAATAEFLKGRGPLHGYRFMGAGARREERIMREGRWFIGRTDWDRSILAAVNPAATYLHCDEIMRPPFSRTSWAAAAHRGTTVYSTSSVMIWKGAETLMEAAAVVARRGVSDLRVRIAGVRPGSELDAYYRRAARRFGVADHIDWLGRLDAVAMAAELQGADVFAYPSHADNSPNSVVEAMLVGVPLVAAGVGGIPSLVADGVEGLLSPRGDAWLLADAILRLLRDPALAARLGAAARERAQRRNDPAAIAARTLEIYEQVRRAARGGAGAAGRRPAAPAPSTSDAP